MPKKIPNYACSLAKCSNFIHVDLFFALPNSPNCRNSKNFNPFNQILPQEFFKFQCEPLV